MKLKILSYIDLVPFHLVKKYFWKSLTGKEMLKLEDFLRPDVVKLIYTDGDLEEIFRVIHICEDQLGLLANNLWGDNFKLFFKDKTGDEVIELFTKFKMLFETLSQTLITLKNLIESFPQTVSNAAQKLYEDAYSSVMETLAINLLKLLYDEGLLDKTKFPERPHDLNCLPPALRFRILDVVDVIES